MKKTYAVVYEWAGRNWSAYSPDVPGCASVGDTLEEVEQNFKEALNLYLEDTVESGDPIPEPAAQVGYLELEIPTLVR